MKVVQFWWNYQKKCKFNIVLCFIKTIKCPIDQIDYICIIFYQIQGFYGLVCFVKFYLRWRKDKQSRQDNSITTTLSVLKPDQNWFGSSDTMLTSLKMLLNT